MRRDHCGACGSTGLDTFLQLGETPLANRYPATADEKEIWYPLEVAVCASCELAQLMEIVDDAEIYGADYGFYSGGSAAQRDYHRRGAELLLSRFGEQAKRMTVEIGCNDGSLLQHFKDAGCPTLGIEPAPGPVEVARGRGLNVAQAPLTSAQSRYFDAPVGLVIAYNCMAHVQDLGDVLDGIRILMDHDSAAVFEVQYLPDLLAGNMYDQIYHEHRYFYSLTSLRRVAAQHGLFVVDAELIELQGGGLRVVLSTHPDSAPTRRAVGILTGEWWLPSAYASVQGRVNRIRDHLISLVDAELAAGRSMAGYGAAAKATTILNFCGIGLELKYVVDTTPYKQGRYVPGTGIPIVSPERAADDPVDTMLLLAANYLGTVLRDNPHKGRWMVPQPMPMVL